jgi:histidinol-phosphate aminotransferase
MIVLAGEQEASCLAGDLLSQGVVVRPLRSFGLPQCLRISTGTDEDVGFCIEAFRRSYGANTRTTIAG